MIGDTFCRTHVVYSFPYSVINLFIFNSNCFVQNVAKVLNCEFWVIPLAPNIYILSVVDKLYFYDVINDCLNLNNLHVLQTVILVNVYSCSGSLCELTLGVFVVILLGKFYVYSAFHVSFCRHSVTWIKNALPRIVYTFQSF